MKNIPCEFVQEIVNTFGVNNQLEKTVEECAELIKALIKYKHGAGKYIDVIDELADVKILMKQMILLFGKEEVDKRVAYKVMRLKKRITQYDPSGNREDILERILEDRSNGKKMV